MATRQQQSSRSLWVALSVLVIVVAGAAYGFGFLLIPVKPPEMQAGLTNIATLGGVTAGLSLAGAAILSLTGRAVHDLVQKYGPWIRGILFGGYIVTILASFTAGLGAMFSSWPGAPWIASGTAAVIFGGLLITALFINSAFRWHHTNPRPD